MLKARSVRHLASVGLAVSSLFVGVVATGAGAASLKPHTEQIYDTGFVTSKMRFIFPVIDPSYNTVTNALRLQAPMYRPLVWFGKGTSNAVQWDLSIANAPTVTNSGKTFTINLKNWKFSDGTDINARSVIFFLNVVKAEAGVWAGYTPGVGIPDKIQSVTQGANDHQVVITTKVAYNSQWALANLLGLITPMPRAWDKTTDAGAAGSGGCFAADWADVPTYDVDTNGDLVTPSDCSAVYDYLLSRGGASSTARSHYNDSGLWHIASGPYKLGDYSSSTYTAKLVPNTAYSGPQKATVSVQFHRYTDIVSYVADMKIHTLDAGSVPTDQLSSGSLTKPGSPLDNDIKKYYTTKYPSFTWGYTFAYINFNTASDCGPSTPNWDAADGGTCGADYAAGDSMIDTTRRHPQYLSKAYIRQALQMSINQAAIAKSIYNGYAVEGCSVIPAINNPDAPKKCPYTYNLKNAQNLLKAHGWTLPAKGKLQPAVCNSPGTASNQCGAGIAKGDKLTLSFPYLSTPGSQFDSMIAYEVSSWYQAGIAVTATALDETGVTNLCFAGDDPGTGTNGNWDLCEYGGWQFGAYPSGEGIFVPGAGGNSGDVDDAGLTAAALAAVTGSSSTAMKDFATYGASYLPYFFQPNTFGVALISKSVKGALPPNSLGDFMPEYITATS